MGTPAKDRIIYRTACEADLSAIARVRAEATNAVRARHGFGERRIDPAVLEPFYRYSLEQEPQSFWVAETHGEVVAMAIAWIRDWLWFLGYLFVAPERQGGRLGRELLERTMGRAGAETTTTKALITMAYNPVSVGFYVRQGFQPLHSVYRLKADTASLASLAEKGGGSHAEKPLDHRVRTLETLAAIDACGVGFARAMHHRFFLGLPGVSGVLVTGASSPLGYYYLHADGQIGPVGALSSEALMDVLRCAFRRAAELEAGQASLFVPAANQAALSFALAHGMKVSEPYLMMSSRPFGNWDCCLLHSAGLL